MNTIKFNHIILSLFMFAAVVACNKEDEPNPLELSTSTLNVEIQKSATLSITNGNGGYTASVADESIVKVEVANNIITIIGLKNGKTTIIITDKRGKTATISVTVQSSDDHKAIKADATRRFEEKIGAQSKVIKNSESTYCFYSDKGAMEIGAGTKLKYKLGWSDPVSQSYLFVMWDGAFIEGVQENGLLVYCTSTSGGKPTVVKGVNIEIIQIKDNKVWLIYNSADRAGVVVQ